MKFRIVVVLAITAALAGCVGDTRNGSYEVYATDGQRYTLQVGFDATTYTMVGNGLNQTGTFTADTAGTTFTFSGNAKFRVAQDLLVGGYDFGSGVKAFVAARKFVTSLSELSGDFNLFGLNLPTGGAADSQIYTSRFTSSTYQACYDKGIYKIDNCPPDSLWTYAMTIDGDTITAVDSAHSDTLTFRMAKSGNTLVHLRAGSNLAGNAQRFRIGLPETAGLTGGTLYGSSTAGSWETTTLTATQYSMTGTSATGTDLADSADLHTMGLYGPLGIMGGSRASDGANLFVMQNSPLAVLVGARSGPLAGYMEISIP